MKTIPLSNGGFVIVDDADYDKLIKFKWHGRRKEKVYYAVRGKYIKETRKRTKELMHRMILGLNDPKVLVDHVNGDGLDNRRSNLRICNGTENTRNSRRSCHNTTGFKGVSLNKRTGKFTARIMADNKRLFLGYFMTAEEASKVYNDKAKELFKSFYRSGQ